MEILMYAAIGFLSVLSVWVGYTYGCYCPLARAEETTELD